MTHAEHPEVQEYNVSDEEEPNESEAEYLEKMLYDDGDDLLSDDEEMFARSEATLPDGTIDQGMFDDLCEGMIADKQEK